MSRNWIILGLAFRDVSLDLLVGERSWRINVGGPNVSGAITIPSAEDSTEPWSLQFDRLHFDVAGRGRFRRLHGSERR